MDTIKHQALPRTPSYMVSGSCVVLDCIDSLTLSSYLLCLLIMNTYSQLSSGSELRLALGDKYSISL